MWFIFIFYDLAFCIIPWRDQLLAYMTFVVNRCFQNVVPSKKVMKLATEYYCGKTITSRLFPKDLPQF